MDARQQKAQEIFAGGKITRGKGCWYVPSQTDAGRHVVDDLFSSCTCDDFELTGKPCKHILAAQLCADPFKPKPVTPTSLEPGSRHPRKTYPQDWPNYNRAQVNEKRHLQALLFELCQTINEPQRVKRGRGRPPLRLADAAFAAIFKVYSTVSARRFSCDLADAHHSGYLTDLPHFNSVLNALDNPALTPILTEFIRLTSLPLREVEKDFAVDSSGFCTSRFTRWFDVKYGVTREQADWVKTHIMCGVKSNVVTAIEIGDQHAADSPFLRPLVKTTAVGFKIEEVSADKAYTGTENFQTVQDAGGTLYAAFKSNTTGGIGGIFERMFHLFCLNREEYLTHYHKRSNVESTFSMVKRKFGDAVRSKTDTAMKNEVLAKFVCHNLCCCVSAWYELGIEPVFVPDACTNNPPPAQILRFPGA
jgi:transposase